MIPKVEKGIEYPEDQYTAVRILVDTLFEQYPESVTEISGISLVELSSDRPEGEDCFGYVFGQDPSEELDRLISEGVNSSHVAGAIAFYFHEGHLAHIGVAESDGMVRSKWGEGHVYKHRPHLVPSVYGRIGGYKVDPNRAY